MRYYLLSFILALVVGGDVLPDPDTSSQECVNSPTNRQCWGMYDISTDYYSVTPDTGHTVEVNFVSHVSHMV